MILPHKNIPAQNGFYSKVTDNRLIKSDSAGAQTFTLQTQTIPPGGYIALHYHAYEESLTFLSGRVTVTIGEKTTEVEAEVTIFIPPHTNHSVQNNGAKPARLIAVHGTAEPSVIYPNGRPEPVEW
ncbi:MAG: cupin domain-containing protein [Moorea sp. SIO4E2]|uniref:cupin domain-containing protein n=1 Tax=Moorena sp. SIO4E2 TaxID=2607826 RepID=UPI0013BD5AF0|nr:cupin domain-containing protein [Moorena sp. SIO4E2]NEQ12238.1 cupin domain-containing protein [Moorena sp. SIO4E2]